MNTINDSFGDPIHIGHVYQVRGKGVRGLGPQAANRQYATLGRITRLSSRFVTLDELDASRTHLIDRATIQSIDPMGENLHYGGHWFRSRHHQPYHTNKTLGPTFHLREIDSEAEIMAAWLRGLPPLTPEPLQL